MTNEQATGAMKDAHAFAELVRAAARDCAGMVETLRARLCERLGRDGAAAIDRHQKMAHGLAWFALQARIIALIADWAERDRPASDEGRLLVARIAAGEGLAQIFGGLAMSQSEYVRLRDFGLSEDEIGRLRTSAITTLIELGCAPESRAALMRVWRSANATRIEIAGDIEDDAHEAQALAAFRDTMRRFAEQRIRPHAQDWHRANALIPLPLVEALGDLGAFGLTLPERYGGAGAGKRALCVATEELSRVSLAVGSLATRAEIAGELILCCGDEAQKARYLPAIASGRMLSAIAFTEPEAGSDLAAARCRATRVTDGYRIDGAKIWTTHAARADLLVLLARTGPGGHRGLSIFLIDKPRENADALFPVEGLAGGEIETPGYRGMREYELAFSNFTAPTSALLGGVEGAAFSQIMRTFESARIQTAARAVGVALSALDLAFAHALERRQFARPLIDFPRVADKIALMASEIFGARLLTFEAARAKDQGRRCDLEAGMAKLYAARVAWAAADANVQVHGGAGFALEHPASRLLADARVLSIFEGAAEIQAQVIARRLLEDSA